MHMPPTPQPKSVIALQDAARILSYEAAKAMSNDDGPSYDDLMKAATTCIRLAERITR